MDATAYTCPHCAAPVDIDYKSRKGYCSVCGSSVTFPRKVFNNDAKVVSGVVQCSRAFLEGRFETAKTYADQILGVSVDNAPALYARAYYEAYVAPIKKSERLSEFFARLQGIDTEYEESESLAKMFLATTSKLADHEEGALLWVGNHLPAQDALAFVDAFCPALILKRTSIDFFTPDLAELYKALAAACSIPKTCFALLQAIKTNPDSPFPENKFFLRTKTMRFYEDFVLPVGEIIQSMAMQPLRDKFYPVYLKTKTEYESKIN